jgi:PGF-pre-PGF domain-containing protein
MKKAGIFALVLVLLASFASAQFTEDFSVASAPALQTFQGTPADTYFQITNTGAVASGYTVSVVDSPVAAWLKMAPLSFTLQPGQSQNVLQHLDIPLDTKPGNYPLQTVFTTALGVSQAVTQTIRVDIPQNIELQSAPEKTILACGTATFPISVINTGAFTDSYALTVSKNIASIAAFTGDQVTLASGQNKTLTLSITPTDCTQSGDIPFTVTGVAAGTKARGNLGLTLHIHNTFIPSFSTKNVRLNTDHNAFNVSITNTGDAQATYVFVVTGADFVTVSPKTLTIDSGATGTLQLASSPTQNTAQQKYPLTLTATVQGVQYSSSLVLDLKNPTWLEQHLWLLILIIIVAAIVVVIGAVALVKWLAYTRTPEYKEEQAERQRLAAELKAERDAEKAELAKEHTAERKVKDMEREEARKIKDAQREEARAQKEADREEARKIRDNARLEAKLDRERKLAAKEATAELKASHVLIAKDSLVGDALVTKATSFWWVILVVIVLAALVLGYGFRTFLLANTVAAIIGAAALAVIIILIIIYAVFFGAKKAHQRWVAMKPRKDHELETGWNSGLGQLWTRTKELVPDVAITVRGSRKNPIFVAPEGHVYQYLTLSPDGIADEQIETQRAQFRVSSRWLARHAIAEGSVKLMRSTADGWKGIGTTKVSSDEQWVYYEASFAGFEPLAIVGKSRAQKPAAAGMPGIWMAVLGVVIILALIGGIWYFAHAGTIKTTTIGKPTVSGIPPQVWDEDTRLSLDLSKHFRDPDSDPLTFTYTPVDHIVVTIANSVATFIPEHGWYGTATITFTADDGKGGKVSSNPIQLIVTHVPTPTFWQKVLTGIERYSGYIVAGIVLLVLLIVALEYRKKMSKEE